MRSGSYTLQYPIEIGGKEISDMTLTPVAEAFKGFKQKVYPDGSVEMDYQAAAAVAVRMTGYPVDAVMKKLDPADMVALGMLAQSFFVSGPPTGKTP